MRATRGTSSAAGGSPRATSRSTARRPRSVSRSWPASRATKTSPRRSSSALRASACTQAPAVNGASCRSRRSSGQQGFFCKTPLDGGLSGTWRLRSGGDGGACGATGVAIPPRPIPTRDRHERPRLHRPRSVHVSPVEQHRPPLATTRTSPPTSSCSDAASWVCAPSVGNGGPCEDDVDCVCPACATPTTPSRASRRARCSPISARSLTKTAADRGLASTSAGLQLLALGRAVGFVPRTVASISSRRPAWAARRRCSRPGTSPSPPSLCRRRSG